MRITFEVFGEPKGKARPRVCRSGHAYTPRETIAYEATVRQEFELVAKGRRFPDGMPLKINVAAFYGIPKSCSRSDRNARLEHRRRPIKKPDGDNILKIIADSLNGIAYKDDAQIVDMRVSKYYSYTPKVVVTIEEAWTF